MKKNKMPRNKLKLLYNYIHFTCQQGYSQNLSSQASTVHELRTSKCTSWIQKKQRNQRSNCQHPLHHRKCITQSCPILCDPHGLWPARFLCPWNYPGKNTGVGGRSLLQGVFPSPGDLPNPGIEPGSPALQADSLPFEPQKKSIENTGESPQKYLPH